MPVLGVGYSDRINYHVPNLAYDANVDRMGGQVEIEWINPATADTDGILDGTSIASAGSTTTFAAAYTEQVMSEYGRNLQVVASGAATSTVTVHGFDYLNQPMTETMTLNGATAVQGVKNFKRVTEVEWSGTSATTIDLGWGHRLGLPYACSRMMAEFVDGAVPGTAGSLVAATLTDPATATTADPRGYYLANSTPNGARDYRIIAYVIPGNMHGVAHFSA